MKINTNRNLFLFLLLLNGTLLLSVNDTLLFDASHKYYLKIKENPHTFYSMILNKKILLKRQTKPDTIYTEQVLQHKFIKIVNSKTKEYIVAKYGGESFETCSEFYNNNKLKSKGDYEGGGLKQGNWFYYYANGKTESEGKFLDGKKTGKWIYYKEDGTLKKEIVY